MLRAPRIPALLLVLAGLTGPGIAASQEAAAVRLVAEPGAVVVEVGRTVPLHVRALDASGAAVDVPIRFAAPRQSVRVRDGSVQGLRAGAFEVVATAVLPAAAGAPPSLRIPVTVAWPAVERVEVTGSAGRLFQGTRMEHDAEAYHGDGTRRPGASFTWSSSDPSVATVDVHGTVTAHSPGHVVVSAAVEGSSGDVAYEVVPFPARSLEIRGGAARARTGDVVTFQAVGRDGDGRLVEDLPVTWAYTFVADDSIAAPGAAALVRDGKFVAEVPGRYTVLAVSGELAARRTLVVEPRSVVRPVEVRGQGSVSDVHTSDLWVFEGVDGRDYALTGTWGGDGWAYVWDVTDPAAPAKTDSIQVDARTVNDVKVSPDGRWGALSREGASNRRNGVVILDLADPAHPVVASTYDDGLTGGVHNMFATEDHLFALSGGDKYVILDVTDPRNPRYVSEYDHPDSRIHDVWVHDGVAYSSEWQNGVVVVDVGNGRWGGSLENPVFVTHVPYPVGATHAAFPYVQESTGKVYLFLGDEIMSREGAAWSGAGLGRIPEKGGTPSVTRGYVHIIDFTDPEDPKDVARYEVPEFGTHNMWVEDDLLYVAYYEGGVRVVDVSGELMGNLADQGREVAVFKAFDPDGFAPNAPMAWGPQPFKGHLFFSDFNSGLWSVRIQPEPRPVS